MKSFWQHDNGKIYALRCNTFGKVTGAAGPLDPDNLMHPDTYDYGPAIVPWLQRAMAAGQLRRINPNAVTRVTKATGTMIP